RTFHRLPHGRDDKGPLRRTRRRDFRPFEMGSSGGGGTATAAQRDARKVQGCRARAGGRGRVTAMKAGQMKAVLERTAQMYREAGASDAADSLAAFATLFA